MSCTLEDVTVENFASILPVLHRIERRATAAKRIAEAPVINVSCTAESLSLGVAPTRSLTSNKKYSTDSVLENGESLGRLRKSVSRSKTGGSKKAS